mmetsp:Transcript_82125/g.96034  ORF Transcript_82125/g.96034 Transcript_82125/m.96034 type:complete len:455 (-) Transcript_82125:87-1451(-)
MVRLVVVPRPRLTPLQDRRRQPSVRAPKVEVLCERLPAVADLVQLVVQPAPAERVVVLLAVDTSHVLLRENVLVQRLRGKHARLHGRVRPLDLRHVQEASAVADEDAAREVQLGDGRVPALHQRPRAVVQRLAALKHLGNERVRLPLLHLHVRPDVRVAVVQPGDEPGRDQPVAEVVQEATAVRVLVPGGGQRPAGSVDDVPGQVLLLRHLPHLLDAEGVRLEVVRATQLEVALQLLRAGAAAPLREDRLLRLEDHPGLVLLRLHALLVDAHVVQLHALQRLAVVRDDRRCGSEAGEDLHTGLGGSLAKELADGTQRHNVVVLVVDQRRQPRGLVVRLLRQEVELIRHDVLLDGVVHLLPPGEKLVERVRLDARPTEGVRPDLRALLHKRHAEVLAPVRKLLQADCRGKPCRPASDHNGVELLDGTLNGTKAATATAEHGSQKECGVVQNVLNI